MEQCEMCGKWRFMMAEGEMPYSFHPFFCSQECRSKSGVSANLVERVYGDYDTLGGYIFDCDSDRGDAT